FVCQGTAIALVAAAALRITERRSPNVRYLIACAGLTAMLAAPAATARLLWTQQPITADAIVDARLKPRAPSSGGSADEWSARLQPSETNLRSAFQPSAASLTSFQLN